MVRSWRLIGKCLRPLPDKWKGLTDQEARVRARYVDAVIGHGRELGHVRDLVLVVHDLDEFLVGRRVDALEIGEGHDVAVVLSGEVMTISLPKVVEASGICLFMPAAAHWR